MIALMLIVTGLGAVGVMIALHVMVTLALCLTAATFEVLSGEGSRVMAFVFVCGAAICVAFLGLFMPRRRSP
jgi:hypothetical protein